MSLRLVLVAVLGLGLLFATVGRGGFMADPTQRTTAASGLAQGTARRCGACHGTEYSLWVSHAHSRFLVDCRTDSRCVVARWGEGARGWRQAVGKSFRKADVALAFGLLQIQVYFRRDADGHRLLPAQWNIREKRWEPLPADLQKVLAERRTWEEECAGCHVTGFDAATGRFGEHGASCQACHGDGGAHAASGGIQGILRPTALPSLRRSEVCGSCHSRGRDRRTGRPYPTAYTPGASLEESFALEAPSPGKATAFFWPDGTERQAYMELQGFRQSGHARAGLACTTCHLAHGSDYPYNLRHKTADLCRSCHPAAADTPVHRSHPKGKATCVDCHMAVVNPARDEAHSHTHTFRFLEPARSVETGMPNACTGSCHRKKDARWAQGVVRWWRGG